MKSDVYTRITNQIIAELEQGVRPWMKPWDAAHATCLQDVDLEREYLA